jgi:hypothetical protein
MIIDKIITPPKEERLKRENLNSKSTGSFHIPSIRQSLTQTKQEIKDGTVPESL